VLSLGRIYADPRLLSSPLNPEDPVKIGEKAVIKLTPQNKWSNIVERQNKGVYDIWASFLQGFGVDAGLGFNFNITGEITCKADELRTQYFDPTIEYLQESINVPSVDRFIRDHQFKKSSFYGDGVKILNA